MKTIGQLMIIWLTFFMMGTVTFAHTDLSKTNPEDGTELTASVSEIVLTYSGQIEEGSAFDVTNEQGEVIPVEKFVVADGVLTGTLESPLENGAYTVNWNSISEDGHPLSGTFSFTVAVPQEVASTEQEEVEETEAPEEQAAEESTEATVVDTTSTETNGSSSFIWIIAGLVLVLVAGSLWMVVKRKDA